MIPGGGSAPHRRAGWPGAAPRDPGQEGFATVTVLALLAVLGCTTVALLALGVLQVQRHRLETAADLAALSAAGHAVEGRDRACGAARLAAAAEGATVTRCELDGLDALVVVQLRLPGRLAPFGPLRTAARAGAR